MINITDSMIYRLGNLNKEQTRISYQMSTGLKLDRGSDDSVTFARQVYTNDKIRLYNGLQTQIQKTQSHNNVADTTMAQVKDALDSLKTEALKALNSGMSASDKKAVAVNVNGIRERIFDLLNTNVDGEYMFSGSDSTIRPFVKDPNFATNGKISFEGDGVLRKVAVDVGIYRERGINGFDAVMYDVSKAVGGASQSLTFKDGERVIDELGFEWRLDNTGASATKLVQYDVDGQVTGEELNIATATPDSSGKFTYTTANVSGNGRVLTAKHSFFDDIQNMMNALNSNDNNMLRGELENISKAYDQANIAHAVLGGRNKIFNVSLENIESKLTHFNILFQEVAGADLSKVAMESKALEMTYTALYSTISKMNELSLVNFVR